MTSRRTKKLQHAAKHQKVNIRGAKAPLLEHLYELRRRCVYVALSVAAGSILAYAMERRLIDILLRPSHGQNFIYTSPLGGMNFLFTVCLYLGLIVSTPIIVYQLLSFMQPLMKDATHRFLLLSSAAAGFIAIGGVLFGYFIGLPSALHFLLHQFVGVQVRPLITIQSYMSFVGVYMLGSALMFQMPLIILFINRIKPLKPSSLFKYERHLVVFAFLAAFIMNPTPNVIDQMLVVVPIIAMYQISIVLLWVLQKYNKVGQIQSLRAIDAQKQAERAQQLKTASLLLFSTPAQVQAATTPVASVTKKVATTQVVSRPERPNQYANSLPNRPRNSSFQSQFIQ